jgi:hypothetical protein
MFIGSTLGTQASPGCGMVSADGTFRWANASIRRAFQTTAWSVDGLRIRRLRHHLRDWSNSFSRSARVADADAVNRMFVDLLNFASLRFLGLDGSFL